MSVSTHYKCYWSWWSFTLFVQIKFHDRLNFFIWSKLQWTVNIIKALFLQGSIYDWVQYHRLHHRTFKTADDPYYSEKDFLHAQVFAHIRSLSPKQEYLLKQIDMKDLESDKIVMFQKKYVDMFCCCYCCHLFFLSLTSY